MKTYQLNGSLREETGKKRSKQLRRSEFVPCVMYSNGEDNIHFYVHQNLFNKLIYTTEVFLIKLQLDGQEYDAILKDVQYHPVTDSIIHADFVKVKEDKKVTLRLPVRLTGNCIGLLNGGKLRQRRRYLKVHGFMKDMPDSCNIDMTNVDIGHYIKISDLHYDNIEILDPPRAMIVGVISSRVIAKAFREPVVEEAVAEKAEGLEEKEGAEAAPEKGEKGEKGEKAEKGDKGEKGEKGDKGEKHEKG
jgi:large subunit ribosomal protein L25